MCVRYVSYSEIRLGVAIRMFVTQGGQARLPKTTSTDRCLRCVERLNWPPSSSGPEKSGAMLPSGTLLRNAAIKPSHSGLSAPPGGSFCQDRDHDTGCGVL